MSLPKVTPHEAKRLVDDGAVLVDIRGAAEHAREHIPGARNLPFGSATKLDGKAPIVFHCRSGVRTSANAEQLAASANCQAYILDGGIDAWKSAGPPVAMDLGQPIETIRQVQIAAGSLVLLGVVLGFLWRPEFYVLSGFIGAGLLLSGITGWCGVAKLLEVMPWNRRPRSTPSSVPK